MAARTDAEDSLLGPRLLLVSSGTAEGEVELPLLEGLLEALGLPHVRVQRRSVVERIDPPFDTFRILMNEELHAALPRHAIPHFVHGSKFPRGVDMEEREGRRSGMKCLAGQVKHHRAVFADRIQHDRPFALGDGLAHDVNALGLENLEMGENRHFGSTIRQESEGPAGPW